MEELMVRGGPDIYHCANGILDKLPQFLNQLNAKRILIVHGEISWQKAQPFLQTLYQSDLTIMDEYFAGECATNEIARLVDLITQHQLDMIIGVGAGKLADTVKSVANKAKIKVGIIPTMASNCAAWTPLSVMYQANGIPKGYSIKHPNSVSLLLVEPKLIIDAPIAYFVAGIGDSLAKWYEARKVLSQPHLLNQPLLMMASYAAEMLKDKLLQYGERAVKDMAKGEVTPTFITVAELIIAISGLVGNLGTPYSSATAAHVMHNALDVHIAASKAKLHGLKVAYGVFFQLALEQDWDEIAVLSPYYEALNLPKTLKELALPNIDKATIDQIAQYMMNPKYAIHRLPFEITSQKIKQAILELEHNFT